MESAKDSYRYNFKIGLVISVDAESQTMTCATTSGTVSGIPINNISTLSGVGIRMMPIPHMTRVLLVDQCGMLYHLGTYYNQRNDKQEDIGLKQYTNNEKYDKECSDQGILQRFLSEGEISITGPAYSEIFFPSNGDVLIVNSEFTSIKLDSRLNSIISETTSHVVECENLECTMGHASRHVAGSSKEREKVYKTQTGVRPESDITKFSEEASDITEFNVAIGLNKNVNTKVFDDESPQPELNMVLSNAVLDNTGDVVKYDGNPLYYLLKIKPANVMAVVDYAGNLVLTSSEDAVQISQSVKYSFGDTPRFNFNIGNTNVILDTDESVNITNAKSTFRIGKTGELKFNFDDKLQLEIKEDMTFSISKIEKDDSGNITNLYRIYSDADNKLHQESKTSIMLQTIEDGDVEPQPMVLGDKIVSLLSEFISAVVNHKHPVSGSTAAMSTDLTQYATYDDNFIKENILSKKNKNN